MKDATNKRKRLEPNEQEHQTIEVVGLASMILVRHFALQSCKRFNSTAQRSLATAKHNLLVDIRNW